MQIRHVVLLSALTLIILPPGKTGSLAMLRQVAVAKGELREMTTEVQEGVWGGPHIIMEVTTTGASITYDCALGAIDQKITLDSKSRFDVRGTHTKLRPGPTRSDETPDRHPARYTGHVEGKNMTLMLELTDTKEKVGTFSLKLGEQPELTRCF